MITINANRFVLPPDQYIPVRTPKDLVLVHETAGWNADGAFQTWMADAKLPPEKKQRVGAALILERDGVVYQTMPLDCWIWHLGIANLVGSKHDERSIAIEVVNLGPLELRKDGGLYAYNKRVCGLDEPHLYEDCGTPGFRGRSYFQAWSPAQKEVFPKLIDQLCATFGIPKTAPAPDKRGVADLGYFDKFKGIASHINFRGQQRSLWGWTFDRWDCRPSMFDLLERADGN